MVIKEMQMRMAYPESCFQATTPEACATATHLCMSRAGSVYELSVRDAVEAFCADSISSPMRSSLANLGPLNLFVISSGKLDNIFARGGSTKAMLIMQQLSIFSSFSI
jgi:hypothetical protein